MHEVVTWDEWIVLFMACLFVGAMLVGSPLTGVALLVPLVVRGYRLLCRPWG